MNHKRHSWDSSRNRILMNLLYFSFFSTGSNRPMSQKGFCASAHLDSSPLFTNINRSYEMKRLILAKNGNTQFPKNNYIGTWFLLSFIGLLNSRLKYLGSEYEVQEILKGPYLYWTSKGSVGSAHSDTWATPCLTFPFPPIKILLLHLDYYSEERIWSREGHWHYTLKSCKEYAYIISFHFSV